MRKRCTCIMGWSLYMYTIKMKTYLFRLLFNFIFNCCLYTIFFLIADILNMIESLKDTTYSEISSTVSIVFNGVQDWGGRRSSCNLANNSDVHDQTS